MPLLLLALSALADDPKQEAPSDELVMDLDSGAGTLAPDAVAEVMKKNNWQVADCFTKNAFRGQTGRMTVEFEIGMDGAVVGARKLDSNLNNPALENCVAGAVKRYKFPKPNGGTVVTTWPFVF